QEVTFIGTYTYTMVEFRETLAGLAAGIFGPLDWIEQRPLAEGVRAFADLKAGGVAAAKIVLRM
ncbi:MAG: galactitol-1-phosphate 5-dehydrogenase, partial [Hyphomicrobiaceae bacterium]|nr:galactitol-1-phosphate 5-dehydrogenase [Hyphomicrobiaceae bacterium]